MNDAQRRAKEIYEQARKELDQKLDAADAKLREEGVEVIDDCNHDVFKCPIASGYHGRRQLNWEEFHRRDLHEIVIESIQQAV